MKIVYADNNATTRIAPEVFDAMVPFLTDQYFNPSSMYEAASTPERALSEAREVVAKHFGVSPSECIFTGCATESNNMALRGTAKANPRRKHIVTTSVEHPAILEVCKEMERNGYRVTFLPVDNSGMLDVADFVRALDSETLMVSIMHANNETGVVFPVAELARITKETDPAIVFHTDATQTVGKMKIDFEGEYSNIDMLSFSGHKIHASKGVGSLIMRKGTPCRPFIIGGHQEGGRRAGTENVASIAGLARALELADLEKNQSKRIESLRNRLESALLEKIPFIQINGRGSLRIPNTSNISCHYIEGEGMLYQLSAEGICASSGSACTSGSLEPSHVLRAMKVPFTAVHGSVRFSFSRYTTEEEVEEIIRVFPAIAANLRKMSPYWDTKNNSPRRDLNTNSETAS